MSKQEIVDLISYIAHHVYVQQVVIIFVYLLAAKIVDLLVNRVLRRLAASTTVTIDDDCIDCVHRPIFWTIFCMGVLHALLYSELAEPYYSAVPAAVQSVILLLWLMALNKFIDRLMRLDAFARAARRKLGHDLFMLFNKFVKIMLVVIGFLWGLAIWDVDLTPLFASAGIAGIAVALAVKDTLANLFGGISMFMDKTFKVGDYIILDGVERGEVIDIGIRSTRIMTRDEVLITVPNSILASTKIVNESAPEPRFRIRVSVGVAYGSDIDQVEEILLKAAEGVDDVKDDPPPRVRFRAFGNSSLDFQLLCWVNEPSVRGLVTHEILKDIYHRFAQEGVEIPFPQMDIHMRDRCQVSGVRGQVSGFRGQGTGEGK